MRVILSVAAFVVVLFLGTPVAVILLSLLSYMSRPCTPVAEECARRASQGAFIGEAIVWPLAFALALASAACAALLIGLAGRSTDPRRKHEGPG